MRQDVSTTARRLLGFQALCAGAAIWAATLTIYLYDDGIDGEIKARAFSWDGLLRGGPYIVPVLLLVGGAAVAMLSTRQMRPGVISVEISLLGLYVAVATPLMFYTEHKSTRFFGFAGTTPATGFPMLFALAVACLIASVRLREGRARVTAVLLALSVVFAIAWIAVQATSTYNVGSRCGTLFDHRNVHACASGAHSLVVEMVPVAVLGAGALAALVLLRVLRQHDEIVAVDDFVGRPVG
jgi:hypothetical protein